MSGNHGHSKMLEMMFGEITPAERETHAALMDKTAELCQKAGIKETPEIFLMKSEVPNAMIYNGRLYITEGLMTLMGTHEPHKAISEELEGIIAHELSHFKAYKFQVGAKIAPLFALPAVAMLGVHLFNRAAEHARNEKGMRESIGKDAEEIRAEVEQQWDKHHGVGHNTIIAAEYFAAALVGVAAGGHSFARISKYFEFEADAFSAQLTGKPMALHSALSKLHQTTEKLVADMAPMKEAQAQAVESIENPAMRIFTKGMQRLGEWIRKSTHPETSKRLERLEGMAR